MWILSSLSTLHRWDSMEVSGAVGSMGGPLSLRAQAWSHLALLFSCQTQLFEVAVPTSMRSNLYRICYSPWGQGILHLQLLAW